jgi:hypothetical protein
VVLGLGADEEDPPVAVDLDTAPEGRALAFVPALVGEGAVIAAGPAPLPDGAGAADVLGST